MKIVRATEANAAQLVKLCKTLGYEVNEEEVRQRVKEISQRSDHSLWVAMDQENAVGYTHGYVRLIVEVPVAIEIAGMVVAEDYQGKGVGRLLVRAIEAWAREKKISRIVLSSNVVRQKAHGFYEHLGYKRGKQQYRFDKWLK